MEYISKIMGSVDSVASALVYLLIVLLFIFGFVKCILPVVRNRATLNRAIRTIKAGDKTGAAEMLALAQHIMDGTIPPFCPHGRPCVLKITRKELEKQFGRLV